MLVNPQPLKFTLALGNCRGFHQIYDICQQIIAEVKLS